MASEKKTLADQAQEQAERPEHSLIEGAAQAIQFFDEDELERFAQEQDDDGT